MFYSRISYVLFLLACGSLLLVTLLPQQPIYAQSTPASGTVLAEACSLGTHVTTDVLCVHGSTWVESSVGDLVALDNVTVTITAGNGQISSTTASPFGQLTPTFGIDIHSLSPQFLQPITISAEINGTQVERSVLLFPDFSTHNQQVDLILHTVNGFDPLGVWGSVTPFDKATAVAGAQITLTASTGTVMTSTTESVDGQPPSYQFDTTTLPIGTAIRVVAAYEGHFDTRSAVIGANPLQLDFVTGWYCDGDDPFPATTSGWGFPATTSGWGFPDVACFYGYVFADGQPAEGVDIYLEFGGKRYQSQTTIYPDETIARYGIAVWGAATITDTTVRISAVQGGVHASKQVDVALDVADQQRIDDLTFDEPSAFAMHTFSDDVRDLVYHNGYVWAATGGGVVRWDPTNLSFEKYTILDGLVHHDVQTIAVDPNGNLWIGTLDGISLYTISEPVPRWISFADAQTFDGQATELVFDDQYVYASGYNSISRADFSSPDNWTLFSQNRTGRITTMQLAANGDLWASRYANRLDWYDLSSDTWTTLTPTHGLLGRYAQAIVPDGAEDIWLGYGGEGLHHYQSSTGTWNVITTAHGLVYNYVYALHLDDTTLWVGTSNGASRYETTLDTWQTFNVSSGMQNDNIQGITTLPDGSVWFATSTGISRWQSADDSWTYLQSSSSLPDSQINALDVDQQGALWIANDTLSTDGGGLTKFDPSTTPPTVTKWDQSTGLASEHIETVRVAPNDDIWLTAWIKGLHHIDAETGDITIYKTNDTDGLYNDRAFDFAFDEHGGVWAGTHNGLSYFDGTGWQSYTQTHGLADTRVYDIEIDDEGNLWLANYFGGLVHVDLAGSSPVFTVYKTLANDVSFGSVNSIEFDSNGILWLVSHNLYQCTISVTLNCERIVVASNINSLEVDYNDDIWLGYQDGIVRRYTPASASPIVYEYEVGEATGGGDVNALLAINDTLWIGSTSGLTAMTIPKRHADFIIELDGDSIATPNDTLTYTIAISNTGDASAGAIVSLELPAGMQLVSAEPASSNATWPITLHPRKRRLITVVTTFNNAWMPGDKATILANVTTTETEALTTNNSTVWQTTLIDPYRSDVGVSLSGPPELRIGETGTYRIWFDNRGALSAENSELTLNLPAELTLVSANPAPSYGTTWAFGTLAAKLTSQLIELEVQVEPAAQWSNTLRVSAGINTSTTESHLSNNMSAANISTVRRDIKTLILTAPERMAAYHGTENTQEKLYNLSQHTLVEGVVIDVLATSTVAAAYAQWDAAPQNQRHARAVSHAIKQLIVQYADDYPQLENVVIVGGDPTIPYYRLYDKSRSKLTERKYMHQRPSILDTTVGQALKRNQILTDDFYTDLQPTNVHTPFYNRTLYLPDLAIGRLVETPAEIGTTIDTFLANDGIITLDTAAVVGDAKLADDWRHQQCDILTNTGFSAPFCTIDGTRYQEALLTDSYQWNMSASHSDYHVLDGRIFASDIVRNQTLNNTLATMYGCHAGLNVMGDGQKLDMAQAFAGRGATYIGSTVYTYGGMKSFTAPYHEISLYTEELGLAFSRRVQNGAPTVGDALRQAKWHYHTVSANAFSYLDEKVMLGMTLYGLPMTRLSTPTTQRAYQPVSYSSTDLPFQFNHNLVSAGYGNHFNTTTVDGSPLGKIAKHGFPIQPQYAVELQTTDNGATLRAVLLNGAAYDSYHNFDPIIAEAVGFNSISTSLYEMQAQFEGYDFQLPYHLSYLIGQTQILTDDQATLVLTLGRYDTDLSQEIVFNEIAIEPLYSSSEDITPPQLVTTTAVTSHKNATFDVQAIDNISVTQVILIADDGEGIWHPVHLTLGGDGWEGKLTSSVSQYYVQVVDGGNNVYTSDWFTPTFGIVSAVSLSSLDSSAPISQLWLFLLLFIGLLVITSKLQWMIRLQKSGKMQRR